MMLLSPDDMPFVASNVVVTRPHKRVCLECGTAHSVERVHGDFCSTACRHTFNNRRKARGAELYDLYMACRYERSLAKRLKLWGALARAAMEFRREDQAQRAGRKSWRAPQRILAERPYLRAQRVKAYRRLG